MTILEQMSAASIVARKARDTATVTIYSTLIAAVQAIGKAKENRLTTDDEAIAFLKKQKVTVEEGLKNFNYDETRKAAEQAELSIIESYLPAQVSEADVVAKIDEIIALGVPEGGKAIGFVLGKLKAEFGQAFDSGKASALIKAKL